MNIDYLVSLFGDPGLQVIRIYDTATEKVLYYGEGDEIPEELLYLDVESLDCISKDTLVINVDTEG